MCILESDENFTDVGNLSSKEQALPCPSRRYACSQVGTQPFVFSGHDERPSCGDPHRLWLS
jgi:hypothetical protein